MIKKLFILICLLLLPVTTFSNGPSLDMLIAMVSPANPTTPSTKPSDGVECLELYDPAITGDQARNIGNSTDHDFTGWLYTAASNQDICQVDVYNAFIIGDPTGLNYHLRIFAVVDGSNIATSVLGTSAAIAGGDLVDGGNWISANAGYFVFSPSISLTNGTTYGFGIFVDDDADLNDAPENDAGNYWAMHNDDERDIDAVLKGRCTWNEDGALPYPVGSVDAEDDSDIKIWSDQ